MPELEAVGAQLKLLNLFPLWSYTHFGCLVISGNRTETLLLGSLRRPYDCRSIQILLAAELRAADVVKIRSSQKLFTAEEVSGLTGICLEHLRALAQSKHLGFLARAAEAAGEQVERWLFTNSDLMILSVLYPRCQH